MVAMPDPLAGSSQYCDMAATIRAGWGGGTCTEIDTLEANAQSMQTAIHTHHGDRFGSGSCDRNGCFARIGGPTAPAALIGAYGQRDRIDSRRPFAVRQGLDATGALRTTLTQDGRSVTTFDSAMAGNPQGRGVPAAAQAALLAANGHYALVVSLWASSDMTWLDGSCGQWYAALRIEPAFERHPLPRQHVA